MTPDNFELWFNELEGYSTRAERFYEDIEFPNPQQVKDWLKAAYNQGVRDANRKTYSPTQPDPLLKGLPPAFSRTSCPRCGINTIGVMGYVCSDQHCPTFVKTTC